MGKVLLASLPEEQLDRLLATSVLQRYTPKTVTDPDRLKQELRIVRRQGYAMADEELAIGVRSVAAPIRNREGEVVAAMNITGPTVRFKGRRIGELRRMVIEGARRISALLGYGESPTTGSGEEADEGG
jgi:DNA-binding IclR family transcriptional regulator